MIEESIYTDDVKLIGDLLKEEWSLGPQHPINVHYEPNSFFHDTWVGGIYVYKISGTNRISSTDYQTIQRDVTMAVRVSNPSRENHFKWTQEVYRILLSNRRHHPVLGEHLFLEITGERESNDLTAYYVTTIELKLTRFNRPIKSAGFGDRINKQISELTTQTGA